MTGQEAVRRGIVALRAAGIEEPEVESGLLLRHALQRDRVYYYLHLPDAVTEEQARVFFDLVRRRCERRPTAYLTGVREFYGIEFYVAPGVLIPRPESELLVEEALRLLRAHRPSDAETVFVDVGTGTGAIVVAVAKNWPHARYFAVDSSPAALQIAELNAKRPRLAGRIEFLLGDLISTLPATPDIIAANLPYIPTGIWEALAPEIRQYEPREALDGGLDGLDVIRRLVRASPTKLAADGALLLEVGAGQAGAVLVLLGETFPEARCYARPDLAGIPRVVVADRARGEPPSDAILR